MSRVIIIAAVASDGAIGRAGQLAFRISDDLRHFKSLTMGHAIIMGRKTFESFPGGALPGRRNIVITRNPDFKAEGAETAPGLREALEMAADDDKVFIIGGGQIYAQAMPLADELCLTDIRATLPDADTFFPPVDPDVWEVCDASPWMTDPKTGLTYGFICLNRAE